MHRTAFAFLPFALLPTLSAAQAPKPDYFEGLKDLSIFLKPRFDSPNTWDQNFGVRAKLVREGNFSAELSYAYDPTYPIKLDVKPRWTTGIQFAYFFTQAPVPIAIYTTPKFNMLNSWKQEIGLNFRLVSKPRYYVNSSIDYQFGYPYIKETTPTFQASLTLGFPLGG